MTGWSKLALFNFSNNFDKLRKVNIEEAYGLISNLESELLARLEDAPPEQIAQIQADLNKVAYTRSRLSQEENS